MSEHLTPAAVCKQLNVSTSTLRKYSLLFEKNGIAFKRNHNNSRLYTATELVALRDAMTVTKSGDKSIEDAVMASANQLKGVSTITQENAVTEKPTQRHDDDATAVMLDEIRGLRKEIKERDLLFVEALEKMQQKIDRLETQLTLPAPMEEENHTNEPVDPEPDPKPEPEPEKKKGFFARLFK